MYSVCMGFDLYYKHLLKLRSSSVDLAHRESASLVFKCTVRGVSSLNHFDR